jgi:hypothetical protein
MWREWQGWGLLLLLLFLYKQYEELWMLYMEFYSLFNHTITLTSFPSSLYIYLLIYRSPYKLSSLSPLRNLNLVHTIVDASWILPPCRVSIRAGIQVPSAKPSSGSTRGVAGAWILAHRYLGRSPHDGACPDICVAVTLVFVSASLASRTVPGPTMKVPRL